MGTTTNSVDNGETIGPTEVGIASSIIDVSTYTTSKTYARITGPFGIVTLQEITDPAQIEALRQMTTDKETHGDDEQQAD